MDPRRRSFLTLAITCRESARRSLQVLESQIPGARPEVSWGEFPLCENLIYQACINSETSLRCLSHLRRLPSSPATGCSCCSSEPCKGRLSDGVQKHMGRSYIGSRAEFVPDWLHGHENSTRKRAVEGQGGGASERERPIGKQSRNTDGCPRCIDERERST